METLLLRSQALNNVPSKKHKEKIYSAVKSCETCSSVSRENFSDGLCKKCALINVIYNRYAESNIPIEYWDLKMDSNFRGYPALKSKYEEIVLDLRKSYFQGTSICFAGSHGLGKTMTVSCILKKASQKGFTCLYTTLSDIVNALTQAESQDKFLARRELVLVDFLVIDEFDSRFISSESSADLFASVLENVFRTRSQNKLPTFMCTNSPNILETFNGPLKQSLGSLMKGYLKMFPVFGEDFRSKGENA
jgi:DNA replication protein DnaC